MKRHGGQRGNELGDEEYEKFFAALRKDSNSTQTEDALESNYPSWLELPSLKKVAMDEHTSKDFERDFPQRSLLFFVSSALPDWLNTVSAIASKSPLVKGCGLPFEALMIALTRSRELRTTSAEGAKILFSVALRSWVVIFCSFVDRYTLDSLPMSLLFQLPNRPWGRLAAI